MESIDRNLALELVRVTEAAALMAGRWMGRGDKIAADQAAVDAMQTRAELYEVLGYHEYERKLDDLFGRQPQS